MEPTADQLQNRLTPTPVTFILPKEGQVFTFNGDSNYLWTIQNGQLVNITPPPTLIAATNMHDDYGRHYTAGQVLPQNFDQHLAYWPDGNYSGNMWSKVGGGTAAYLAANPSAQIGDFNRGDFDTALQKGYNFQTGSGSLTVNNTPNTIDQAAVAASTLAAQQQTAAYQGQNVTLNDQTGQVTMTPLGPSTVPTTGSATNNADIQALLTNPSLGTSGNYARTANGSIVDLSTGQVVATGGATTQTAVQAGNAPQPTQQPAPLPGTATVDPATQQQDALYGAGPLTPGAVAGVGDGSPMFMGSTAIIQIDGYPGTYLVDKSTQTIRPFISDKAVVNAIPNISSYHIVAVPPSALSLGGMFGADKGFQMLDSKYAIQEDGKFLTLDASNAQLQTRYGHPIDQNAEQDAYLLLDGIMGGIKDNPNGGIPTSFLDTLKNDHNALAFMISAIAYGGYTPGDVYSDMKRRYLMSQGDTSLQNTNPISAVQTRDQYQLTDAGKQALSDPKLTPPTQIGTLDPSIMKLPLFQIPQQAFNTLIPIMNPDTQQFKDAMAQVQDAYHDILLQQLSATTEQQKAIADSSWQTFRDNVQRTLGISLSNNALDAWTQMQNAYQQFGNNNISGSGLESESIDDYLQRVRTQASSTRQTYSSQQDAQEALYYQKYATPQQVKDLIASNPAKAQAWGLVPSSDIKTALSFATLKAKYPNLTDQQINDYIASTLDENGNYRSALYQTYMTNKLQTLQDEQTYKQGQVLNNSLLDEAKAYREFTTPDVAFLRDTTSASAVGSGLGAPVGDIMGSPAQYQNIFSVLGGSYANMPAASTPTTTSPTPTTGGTSSAPAPTYPTYQPPAQTPTSTSYPSYSYPSILSQTGNTGTQQGPINFGALNITNPLSQINTSFSMPAAKPTVSPFAGATTPQQETSTAPASFNMGTQPSSTSPTFGSIKTTTPSTVGTASSKTVSALSSGWNALTGFGSQVAGGFMSLFGA